MSWASAPRPRVGAWEDAGPAPSVTRARPRTISEIRRNSTVMAVSLSGVVPGLSPIVQPSAVTTSPSARVLRPRPTCRNSRRSWHHRSYRTMGAAQLPGFSTSFTIGLTPCSRQLSGARRSSHAPSALTNRREEVAPRGNDSREGPDEKVHTMRAVWSTDATDWLRDWGQGEDRLSIQVRELRAHAREDAQGNSIGRRRHPHRLASLREARADPSCRKSLRTRNFAVSPPSQGRAFTVMAREMLWPPAVVVEFGVTSRGLLPLPASPTVLGLATNRPTWCAEVPFHGDWRQTAVVYQAFIPRPHPDRGVSHGGAHSDGRPHRSR